MTDAQQLPVGTRVRILDPESTVDDYGTVVAHSADPFLHGHPQCCCAPHMVKLDDGDTLEYCRAQLEDVTPLVTFESEDLKAGAHPRQWELGCPVYHLGAEQSFVVRTAHYASYKGWIYGLSPIGDLEVCMDARESVLRPYSESHGLTITREQLDAWAEHRLSDADLKRLAECIPNSSIPDAIAEIVAGWD